MLENAVMKADQRRICQNMLLYEVHLKAIDNVMKCPIKPVILEEAFHHNFSQ